jgi:hypothetical protein
MSDAYVMLHSRCICDVATPSCHQIECRLEYHAVWYAPATMLNVTAATAYRSGYSAVWGTMLHAIPCRHAAAEFHAMRDNLA